MMIQHRMILYLTEEFILEDGGVVDAEPVVTKIDHEPDQRSMGSYHRSDNAV